MVSDPNCKVSPFDIIKSICSYEGMISFNLNESDVENDMHELLASMIVCDGNEEKGTRTAVFHPKYKEFGCSVDLQGKRMIVYMIFAEKVDQSGGNGKSYSAGSAQLGHSGEEPSNTR